MRKLHILNGEGTASSFSRSGISGDNMVWNEALCQGPPPLTTSLTEFMEIRTPFLAGDWEATSTQLDNFRQQWEMLLDLETYQEITLWFEYDLFCQANLLYLSHFLHSTGFQGKVTLVSPANHPEVEDFRGMGQLSSRQLAGLYPNRTHLDSTSLAFGSQIWKAWCQADLTWLSQLSQETDPGWPHLSSALIALFEELPSTENGTSLTEQIFLEQLVTGPKSRGQAFRHFLHQRDLLGYGDLQFFQLVDGLAPHFVEMKDNSYHLKLEGRRILRHEINRTNASIKRWVGPILLMDEDFPYQWDRIRKKIVPSPDLPNNTES